MSSKKIIIFSIVIIIMLLILACIGCFFFNNRDKEKKENIITENSINNEEQDKKESSSNEVIDKRILKKVNNRDDFYAVRSSVNKFYEYYMLLFSNQDDEDTKNTCQDIIYSMLDKKYISYRQINKENISSKLQKINDSTVNFEKIYISNTDDNISTYIVNGILNDKLNNKQVEFSIIVNMDMQKGTFKLLLDDYVKEKYPNIKLGNILDFKVEDNIDNNEYNVFEYKTITDEEYVTDMFNKLRDDFVYNQKGIYNTLNEKYREDKFQTASTFKEYVQKNAYKHITMKIDKYNKYVYDNYVQYVCIDNNGNYYIFNEKAILDYEIFLDTYTVELPEFIEKYNKSNEQSKVGMNVQKVMDAINDKDYRYVYNKLNVTFRENNFKTIKNLEEYLKNKIYDTNKIEYGSFKKEESNYIYIINVKDAKNINNSKKITIIMKLNENTDFEMSFSIE